MGRGKRSWEIPHTKYAPLDETQRKNKLVPRAPLGEAHCFIPRAMLGDPIRSAGSDAYWQQVCHETKIGGETIHGKTALPRSQKKVTTRSAMQHLCSRRVQFVMDANPEAWWSGPQRETYCSKMIRVVQGREMAMVESGGFALGENPSGE